MLTAITIIGCVVDVSSANSPGYVKGMTAAEVVWVQSTSNKEVNSESISYEHQDSIDLFIAVQSKANSFSNKSQLQPDLDLSSTQLPPDRVKAFNVRYRMLEPHLPWFLSPGVSGRFRLGGWKESLSYFDSESIHS